MVPRLSMRQAAAAAAADGMGSFSVALWTSIENGYQQAAKDTRVPVTGTPDRIARMARIVGATKGELERAGRHDAARVLAQLPPARPAPGRGSLRERVERIEQMARELRLQLEEEDEEEERARRRA